MSIAESKKNKVKVGDLSQDFLRVGGTATQQQVTNDYQAAAALQQAQGGFTFMTPNLARLSITVCQAKLTKNYGLMKMDLYCRMRIGHSVFETHTANGGGKNPRWNKVIQCHIPPGVDAIYMEIFDEKAFTMDDRVAWSHIPIPEKVFTGESVEEWWHLNGKQGDGKEGMVNLVLSYTPPGQTPVQQPVVYSTGAAPVMVIPQPVPMVYPPQVGGAPVMIQQPIPGQQVLPPGGQYPQQLPQQLPQQQQQPPQPQGPLYTEEDIKQIKDVFPNVEEDVVKSVMEANRGNKEATINSLLSMAT